MPVTHCLEHHSFLCLFEVHYRLFAIRCSFWWPFLMVVVIGHVGRHFACLLAQMLSLCLEIFLFSQTLADTRMSIDLVCSLCIFSLIQFDFLFFCLKLKWYLPLCLAFLFLFLFVCFVRWWSVLRKIEFHNALSFAHDHFFLFRHPFLAFSFGFSVCAITHFWDTKCVYERRQSYLHVFCPVVEERACLYALLQAVPGVG